MVERCSSNSTASTFSFFFPLMCSSEGGGGGGGSMTVEKDSYSFYCPSSTSSVDCTLSLGTPSTRNGTSCMSTTAANARSSSPGLGWDTIIMTTTQSKTKHPRLTNVNAGNLGLPLARRCANCNTASTPLWRNGPRGPKSLCNACGIRYKKEERRAAASTTANATESINGYCTHNYNQQQQKYPWSCYQSTKDTNNLSLLPSSRYQNDQDHYLPRRHDAVPPPQFEFDRPTLFH